MEHIRNAMERFFGDFERNSNAGETMASVSQFADVFMFAGPDGVQTVRASDFALALPKRKKLFDQMGCQSTKLVTMSETKLDGRYVLVETEWLMTFARDEGRSDEVLAGSAFLIDTGGTALKIVLYLTHQDIMALLRNRGILPT